MQYLCDVTPKLFQRIIHEPPSSPSYGSAYRLVTLKPCSMPCQTIHVLAGIAVIKPLHGAALAVKHLADDAGRNVLNGKAAYPRNHRVLLDHLVYSASDRSDNQTVAPRYVTVNTFVT